MAIELKVPDMSCSHCLMRIRKTLEKIPGVEAIEIDLKTKVVRVTGTAIRETILQAIKDAGYSPE